MEQSGCLYCKEKLKVSYTHTAEVHNMNAPREVVPYIMELVKPTSVLDVGCGTGTWLKAFEEAGVNDYLGIDGGYVNRETLKISQDRFRAFDLRHSWTLKRKFDLVISLEVVEHLPETSADLFVEALISHGNVILFSAAIPGQDGQNHLNEQWPEYWQEKFIKHGFYFHDVIRPLIWNNEKVDLWYKQNIFLVRKSSENLNDKPLSIVHPDLFKLTISNHDEYIASLVEGRQGVRLAVAIFFNSIKYKLKSLLGLV